MAKAARQAAMKAAVGRGRGGGRTRRPRVETVEAAPTGVATVAHDDDDEPRGNLLDTVVGTTAAELDAAVKEAAAHMDRLPRITLATITPHPHNPPERALAEPETIELGEDIKANGLQQPIVIAPRQRIEEDDPAAAALLPEGAEWVIIIGHRRYAGSVHVGLTDLPALVRTGPCDPVTIADIFLSENFQRKKPDAIMEAQAYERYRTSGLSTTQIAERRGVAQGQVVKTLKLTKLVEHSPQVAAKVRSGEMTRADAYAFLELAAEDRDRVFAAWEQSQTTDEPQTLRVCARRLQRSDQAKTPPAQTTAPQARSSPGESAAEHATAVATRTDDQQTEQAPKTPSGPAWLAALQLPLSATVRADILTDADLCTNPEDATDLGWRAPVATALGIDLPETGPLDGVMVKQVTWRRIAVGRALWLLEQAAGQCADDEPPHVQRHRQRLADLGLA
ncbi:ParB N-terminal domain-containing protein [Saccharopolyspora sp. K220]|uniref:ParB/RepB/Spo0J family partition protein n=1 Tax=Saccharopolyspora soli TaxID=2926618 RepID=UPI001F5734FA|nr:ParB N-terminal domain-containing protein [Saccharopolyspora soli]MCI2423894.1 ParB N-terminal domain-containing protein [Saccharopolyspora soli]